MPTSVGEGTYFMDVNKKSIKTTMANSKVVEVCVAGTRCWNDAVIAEFDALQGTLTVDYPRECVQPIM